MGDLSVPVAIRWFLLCVYTRTFPSSTDRSLMSHMVIPRRRPGLISPLWGILFSFQGSCLVLVWALFVYCYPLSGLGNTDWFTVQCNRLYRIMSLFFPCWFQKVPSQFCKFYTVSKRFYIHTYWVFIQKAAPLVHSNVWHELFDRDKRMWRNIISKSKNPIELYPLLLRVSRELTGLLVWLWSSV